MEKRKDYILDEWSIIVEGRNKRPEDFASKEPRKIPESSPFSPGKENFTPPEIGRIEKGGHWQIRWFPNKFPILQPTITGKKSKLSSPIHGYSELIVEDPEVSKLFSDFSIEHIKSVLKVYNNRINDLSSKPGIKYVCVFRNQGKAGGASLVHPHSQVIAVSEIPPRLKKKLAKCKSSDEFSKIISLEKKSSRKIFEDKNFFVLAPYASRFPFTALIIPKALIRNFNDFNENIYKSLATILKKLTSKLDKLNMPYNIMYNYNPDKKNKMRMHISLKTRISIPAGFEFESGYAVNVVTPENAAKFYRS